MKLMDNCRDRCGDSGSATYAKKSDSELGVFAVGLLSGQNEKDCDEEGTARHVLIQGLGPILARGGVQLLRTDLPRQAG